MSGPSAGASHGVLAASSWPALADSERIARIAQRLDAVERLELLAQPAHDDVDGPGVKLGFMAAQTVENVVAAPDFARLVGQQGQQFEFGTGQVHALALSQHFT